MWLARFETCWKNNRHILHWNQSEFGLFDIFESMRLFACWNWIFSLLITCKGVAYSFIFNPANFDSCDIHCSYCVCSAVRLAQSTVNFKHCHSNFSNHVSDDDAKQPIKLIRMEQLENSEEPNETAAATTSTNKLYRNEIRDWLNSNWYRYYFDVSVEISV